MNANQQIRDLLMYLSKSDTGLQNLKNRLAKGVRKTFKKGFGDTEEGLRDRAQIVAQALIDRLKACAANDDVIFDDNNIPAMPMKFPLWVTYPKFFVGQKLLLSDGLEPDPYEVRIEGMRFNDMFNPKGQHHWIYYTTTPGGAGTAVFSEEFLIKYLRKQTK